MPSRLHREQPSSSFEHASFRDPLRRENKVSLLQIHPIGKVREAEEEEEEEDEGLMLTAFVAGSVFNDTGLGCW